MKVVDRLVMFLLALGVMAVGIFAIFAALQRQAMFEFLTALLAGGGIYSWGLLLGGVVLIFIALVIIIGMVFRRGGAGESRSARRNDAVATSAGEGVKMSVTAVDSIVRRAASTVPGVGEPQTDIASTAEGDSIEVSIKVPIIADVNIPETISNLNTTVQHYLENMAGLRVANIKVLVTEVMSANAN